MLSNTAWAHHDRTRAQTQINIHWLSLTSDFSRSLSFSPCVCEREKSHRIIISAFRKNRVRNQVSTPMKYYVPPIFFIELCGNVQITDYSSFHTTSAPSGEMQTVTAAKKIQLLQLLLPEETYKKTQCDCCHWGLYCRTHPHEAFPKCNAFKSEVGALNDLFLWWKRQMPWSEVSHAQIYSYYLQSTGSRQSQKESKSLTPQLPVNSPALLSLRDSGVYLSHKRSGWWDCTNSRVIFLLRLGNL